jgi:hypothetical protein
MLSIIQNLYIDPGSGSLLFQMILSGLLTILVFFKRFMLFVKALITGKGHQISKQRIEKK